MNQAEDNEEEEVIEEEVNVAEAPNEGRNENIDWSKVGTGLLVGGVVGFVAVPIVVTAGLYCLGFTATGIAAGSFAAASQAAVGNVAAGSWIATCTSLGMTGAAAAATPGAVVGAAAGAGAFVNKEKHNNQV